MRSFLVHVLNKHRPALWLLWLASIGAVAYGSLNPHVGPPSRLHLDKVLHFSAYGWLALLPGLLVLPHRRRTVLVVLGVICISGAIEIGQSYLPPRQGSWSDFAANSAGAVFGVWLARAIQGRQHR